MPIAKWEGGIRIPTTEVRLRRRDTERTSATGSYGIPITMADLHDITPRLSTEISKIVYSKLDGQIRQEAPDIAQDAWLVILENVAKGRYTSLGHVRASGYTNARYRAQDELTASSGRRKVNSYYELDETAIQSPEAPNHHDKEYNAALVNTLTKGMPSGLLEVLQLHIGQQLTHKEIAELLGISEGASKSRVFRAKRYARARLASLPTEEGVSIPEKTHVDNAATVPKDTQKGITQSGKVDMVAGLPAVITPAPAPRNIGEQIPNIAIYGDRFNLSALAELSSKARELFLLAFGDGLSIEEIAIRKGSVYKYDSIKYAVGAARRKYEKVLKENEKA